MWTKYLADPEFADRISRDPIGRYKSPDELYEIFRSGDPTSGRNFRWILESYRDGGIRRIEDISSRIKQSLTDYTRLVARKVKLASLGDLCGLIGCNARDLHGRRIRRPGLDTTVVLPTLRASERTAAKPPVGTLSQFVMFRYVTLYVT